MAREIYKVKIGRNTLRCYHPNDAWRTAQEYFAQIFVQHESNRKFYPIPVLQAKNFVVKGKSYKITRWDCISSEPTRILFTVEKDGIHNFQVELCVLPEKGKEKISIFTHSEECKGFTKECGWEYFEQKDIHFRDGMRREIKNWLSGIDAKEYFYPFTLELDRYRDVYDIVNRMF